MNCSTEQKSLLTRNELSSIRLSIPAIICQKQETRKNSLAERDSRCILHSVHGRMCSVMNFISERFKMMLSPGQSLNHLSKGWGTNWKPLWTTRLLCLRGAIFSHRLDYTYIFTAGHEFFWKMDFFFKMFPNFFTDYTVGNFRWKALVLLSIH